MLNWPRCGNFRCFPPSAIRYLPTINFIEKKGLVRKIHSGFYGPGAPEYFEAYKKFIEGVVQELLQE
jgi:hypothetical protein